MKDVVQHIGRLQVFRPGLFILVSLAALLRLAMSLHFPRAVKEDEPAYLLLGQNLWAGNGFTYTGLPELHFPPLHPLLIGLFSFITRDLEMASNLEHAVFGGLLLLPVFAIALRIYGVQTAWLAVILLALFPPLTVSVLYWGSMSESTFLFFLFSALALFLAGLDDERPWMVSGAGGVLGLAYLIRDEAIAFFGALTIFVVLWLWTHEKAQTFRMWRAVVLFVLSFVLVAAPYIWYLHVHTGKWMISGKLNVSWKAGAGYGDNGKSLDQLYNGLDSSGEEINSLSMERFREDLLGHVISHPSDILHRVVRHAGSLKEQFFTRSSFWWGLTPLVVLGLFNQPWDRRRLRYEAFLITIIVVLLIVFLPFGFLVRYFAPAYPVLLMWTAMGALGLGRWLQDTVMLAGQTTFWNRYVRAGLNWMPAGMAVLALVLTIPVTAERAISSMYFGDKEAGLWLRTHAPVDAKVMSRDPAVAVYAGRVWVPSPRADWARFLKYAAAHGATHLVVRDYLLKEYRPELAFIVQNGAPELELLYTFRESYRPERVPTLVYRILRTSE